MKINFRTILSILIILNFRYTFAASDTNQTEKKNETSDATLNSCYKEFPLLQESLMLLSDSDFADQKKSQKRKLLINRLYEKNPSTLRECVRSIVKRAENENDPDNTRYVNTRMREFTSIVFPPQRTNSGTSTGTR